MKSSARIELVFMIGAILLLSTGANAQRQMENLGRGVVAVRTNTTTAYVGWRMLGTDPEDIGFNLYRSTTNGTPVQLTTNQTQTTDFVDTTADLTQTNSYSVRPVINGV
jgi:rhamnogalacturonan endolyase